MKDPCVIVNMQDGRLRVSQQWNKARYHSKNMSQMNKLITFLVTHHSKGFKFVRNNWNKEGYLPKCSGRVWSNPGRYPLLWSVDLNKDSIVIYIKSYLPSGDTVSSVIAYANHKESNSTMTGIQATKLVDGKFRELTGISINQAFGYINAEPVDSFNVVNEDKQEEMLDYKAMQPFIMVWNDKRFSGIKLNHYHKADVCSAYPYNCHRLPDYNSRLELKGHYELKDFPEYDFCFYRKSHHIVERDILDTRELYKDKWAYKFKRTPNDIIANIDDNDEITVFMKYSKYDMIDTFNELYKQKEYEKLIGVSDTKSAMVSFIGAMQSVNYSKLTNQFKGFISAIVYLRHIKYMLNKIHHLEDNNCRIIHIATDSIGWIGKDCPEITTDDKYLGAFHKEYTDTEACVKANGVYAIKDGDEFKICTQGVSKQQSKVFRENMKDVTDINNLDVSTVAITDKTINGINFPLYAEFEVINDIYLEKGNIL